MNSSSINCANSASSDSTSRNAFRVADVTALAAERSLAPSRGGSGGDAITVASMRWVNTFSRAMDTTPTTSECFWVTWARPSSGCVRTGGERTGVSERNGADPRVEWQGGLCTAYAPAPGMHRGP